MKNLVLVFLLLAALLVGFLVGSGELGFLGGTGAQGSKTTQIRLLPGTGGNCVAKTQDHPLRARRQWFVGWEIRDEACQLAEGGLVEIRFTSGSPLLIPQPSPSDSFVVGYVRESAEQRTYPYKVWAVFPNNPDANYILEDPDLEIVTYFTFF